MKGLIPAAGKGTRLEPITLAIPKELLMVGDKAIIEHVIDAFKIAGITDITVVVGWKKHAILDYLGSGERLGVHLTYVVQDTQNGWAKAIQAGERVIGDEPFALVLGDDFFYPKSFLKDLIEFHQSENPDVSVGVTEVEDPTRHGMIKPRGNEIIDIIEKPSREAAPSNLGCIGVYVFTPAIFAAIRETKIGLNNEYQLADSMKILIAEGRRLLYKRINGEHIDVGTPKDLVRSNLRYIELQNANI
ncbi:MAG: NTP transferase domain-containing protein [Methanomicrobia archaeon]|nr:NTP transferase domain-containing protein [Methanomicrobia archaeon]